MSIGSLTFNSLARLHDYRSNQSSTAPQERSKAKPISLVSPQIPTGTVNEYTDQALQWSGLKPAPKGQYSAFSAFMAGSTSSFQPPASSSYQMPEPALDFAYSFASIKGILAYRDALQARIEED